MTENETNAMVQDAIVIEEAATAAATFPLQVAATLAADEGDGVVQRTVSTETDIAAAHSDDSPRQENLEASLSNSNPPSAHESSSSTHLSLADPASDDVVPLDADADVAAAPSNPTVNDAHETSAGTVAEDETTTIIMPNINDNTSRVEASDKEVETVVVNTTSTSTVALDRLEIDNTTLATAAEHDNGPTMDEALEASLDKNSMIHDPQNTAAISTMAVVAEAAAAATTESTTVVEANANANTTTDTMMALQQQDNSVVVVNDDGALDADKDEAAGIDDSAGSGLCDTNNHDEFKQEAPVLEAAAAAAAAATALEEQPTPPALGSSMEHVEQPQQQQPEDPPIVQPEPEPNVAEAERLSSSRDDKTTTALVPDVTNVGIVSECAVPPSTVETATIVSVVAAVAAAEIDSPCNDGTKPASLQLDDEIARALNDETVSTIVDHALDDAVTTNVVDASIEADNAAVEVTMEMDETAAAAEAASLNATTKPLPKETATDETKVQDDDALAPTNTIVADPAYNKAQAPESEAATTTTAGVVHTTVDDDDKAPTSGTDAVHSAVVHDATECEIGAPESATKSTDTEPVEASDATTEMTTMAAVPTMAKDEMEDAPPLVNSMTDSPLSLMTDATTTESVATVDNTMDFNDNAAAVAAADQTTTAAVAEDDKLEVNHASSTAEHLETELANDAPVVQADIESVPVDAMDPSTPLLPAQEAACEAANAMNREDTAPTKDDDTKDVVVDDKDDACIAADADTSTAVGASAATTDSTPNDDETVAISAVNVSISNEAEMAGRSVEQVDEPAVPSPSAESETITTAPPSDTDGPLEPSKEETVDSPLDSMNNAAITDTAAIPSSRPDTKSLDNTDPASVSTSAASSKSSDDVTSKSPKQSSSIAAAGKAKFTSLSTTASAALSPSAPETSSPTKQRKKLAIPSIFEKGPSSHAATTTTPTTPVRSFSPKKVSNAYVSSIAAKKELAPPVTAPKGPVKRTFTPISAAKSWKGAESSKAADATVVDSSKQPATGATPGTVKAPESSNTNVKSTSIDAVNAPAPSAVSSIAMPVAAVDNAEEPTTSTTGKVDACSTEKPMPPSSSDDLKLDEAVIAHKGAPTVNAAESLNDGSTTETISNGTTATLVIPTEANDAEKMDKSETQATTRRKIAVPSIFAAPKQTEPMAPPKTPTRVWTKKAVVIPDNQFVPLPPANSASAFSVKRTKEKAIVTETTPLYSLPKPIAPVSADKPTIVEQAPSTTTELTLEEQIAALEAEIAQTAAAAEAAKAAAFAPAVTGNNVEYEEESYYEEAEGSENTIETLEEMHILSSQTEPENPTCSAETAEEVVDTVTSAKDGDPTAVADSNSVDIPDNDIVKTTTTTTVVAYETESVRYDDNKVADVVSGAAQESGGSTMTVTEAVDETGSSRNVDTDVNPNNATDSNTSIANHAVATPEEPRPKYVYKPPPEIEEPTALSKDEAHPSFEALDTAALDTLTPDTAPFDEAAKLTSPTKIVKDDIPYDEVTLVPSVEGNMSDVPHREISLMPTDVSNSIASMPKTTDEIVQAECAPAAPAAAAATNQDLAGEPAQGEKAPKKKLRRLRSFFQNVKEKSKRRLVPGRPKGPKSQA